MARSWEKTGSPLRPCAQDVAVYAGMAQEWVARHGIPRVLLLGVTPEIYRLPWPEGCDFVAVDQAPAMIEFVWPGDARQVVQANWLDLPLPTASRDLVFCDGGLHLLDYPRGQQRLIERLHDVVAPGGRCIFRLFTPPAVRETEEQVLEDLGAGRIPNLNVLKLRLGMAMQSSPESGIAVRAVWNRLHEFAQGSWEALALQLGWPLDELMVIDTYRESKACYHFVSRAEVEELFCGEKKFVQEEARTSDYILGERCPVVALTRR
jgi:SAM-dependent methyltransferase